MDGGDQADADGVAQRRQEQVLRAAGEDLLVVAPGRSRWAGTCRSARSLLGFNDSESIHRIGTIE